MVENRIHKLKKKLSFFVVIIKPEFIIIFIDELRRVVAAEY